MPPTKRTSLGQPTLNRKRHKGESSHYEFVAVRRLHPEHEIKDWQRTSSFGHFKAEGPKQGSRRPSKAKSEWTKLGHISGVYVLHDWSSSVSSTAELAAYTTFNSIPSMSAFCDNVVADINHAALRVTYRKFTNDAIKTEIASDSDDTYQHMSPSTVLRRVKEDVMLQDLLAIIEAGCKKPTLVPITVSVLKGKNSDNDCVDATAFVAVHALQILMFASIDWAQDRPYSRDLAVYEHRYPTPSGYSGYGGGETAAIGPYSFEDFHRAVCLFWMAHTRRESPQRNILGRVPGNVPANFRGYYDPDAWKPDFEEENDSKARFAADQGMHLQSIHEEFLAVAEHKSTGIIPQAPTNLPQLSPINSQGIAGDELFELYAMAANAMDVEVARKGNDPNDLGADLYNDLPEMLTSDFKTLFTVLNKKFGQSSLASNAELTRRAIDSFMSLVEDDVVVTGSDLELAPMEIFTEELRGADKLFGSDKALAASQLQQLRDGTGLDHDIIAGVEHVKALATHSVHGGLDFFFSKSIMDPNIPAPILPQQWLRWLLGGSPIMTRVLITFATMEMAGFKVNTIRSSDKSTKRAKLVAEFTDPTSNCEIFLTDVHTITVEANLQACCSKGIMMSYPHDAEILKQVHRSLRIGQTQPVTCHMLKAANSFNDHQERLCMSQWAKKMPAEMVIENWYPDNIREMIIYEFLLAYFGQPFNRYAWVLLQDWDPANFSYNSDHTVKIGHAITCVAMMCVSAKDKESHILWTQLSKDLVSSLIKFVEGMSVEEVRGLTLKEQGELADEFLMKLLEGAKAFAD
ncbi:uncharacterized protein TRIVIDRAFT_68566 [Trichoderma virens Gv29-8]|uniref:Uncharacterized protein n=1 Tax=Hypocrea virens (strain Gv29-8 / FGSC 10586) TaxID=413071 RepID=G9MZC6_HYPVG|nr:uncharacterized protein TRIVIDRAFT_68566 [Trichoderma virens Gv29-8]EHK19983.1 hypothetical protein TRIVIDRAFT_68566 [Trichoderma virens Gv29-8]